jgi:hypothetical protein
MDREKKLENLKEHPLEISQYPELHDDTAAVLIALDNCESNLASRIYNYASHRVRTEDVILLSLLSKDGKCLEIIPPNLKVKRLVLVAVNNAGMAILYAPDELLADKEVVLAAVNNDGRLLIFAADELLGDKEVVLAAVNNDGTALEYASVEMRGDKEVVLAAVNNHGRALQYVADELRGDKEVVLAALKKHGRALQYVADELRGDKEVVLAAVNNNGGAFQYASKDLQGDKDLIIRSLRRPHTEAPYNNINMPPSVGDYVMLNFRDRDPNPVVHTVTEIVPPDKVRLNGRGACPIRSLDFIPKQLVFNHPEFGLRLMDRTFTIRGGKRKKHTKRFKKKYSVRKGYRTRR